MPQLIDLSLNPRHLAGQVALITGGGRGLGRAYVIALAMVGAAVAVTARTEPKFNPSSARLSSMGSVR